MEPTKEGYEARDKAIKAQKETIEFLTKELNLAHSWAVSIMCFSLMDVCKSDEELIKYIKEVYSEIYKDDRYNYEEIKRILGTPEEIIATWVNIFKKCKRNSLLQSQKIT